ncbi:putative ribonucleotide reductase [Rhypophila decipiens]|uniref:Ribonucleotide reductase n=1 Tax=Rhypophila decipiens TaxID=261697 RepID=A0AAN6YID4_9PEZI|nr:putative ribonucleotide reductase [Rhypophila decipiens]
MSTGPRTKRQFAGAASDPAQRQITSFFNKTSNPTSHHHVSEKPTTGPLNGPTLPAHIQSNLISVGMRVRKSVPEGYKTGSACSGFSLWSDSNSNSAAINSSAAADHRPVPAVPSSQYVGGSSARELTPFCGIHKVGGLAAQPETIDYSFLGNGPSGLKSMPSSQESNSSVTSAMAATSKTEMNRKRIYTEEEEAEEQATPEENDIQRYTAGWFPENGSTASGKPNGGNISWRNRADWLDGEISPRSPAPAEWGDSNARVMAVPRRRIAANTTRSTGNGGGLLLPPGASGPANGGQGNVMVVDDFEEASFLDFRFGSDGAGMEF